MYSRCYLKSAATPPQNSHLNVCLLQDKSSRQSPKVDLPVVKWSFAIPARFNSEITPIVRDNQMKFYIDTADLDELRVGAEMGVITGVTTNPTLIAKVSQDMPEKIRQICSIINGPIHAEPVSDSADAIIEEARMLTAIHDNVVAKIAMSEEGLKAVKVLSREGITCSVTLIFSAVQALLAAEAGAQYIIPFIGRLDDISNDGIMLSGEIRSLMDRYHPQVQVLAASIRHPMHIMEAARAGADIVTAPLKVLKQLYRHPLTERGLAQFKADWEKVKSQK